ncbi:hypothetical protein DVH24_029945 [Malus domestica]|uniref:Uncharacterized protein n=1 Tax=Malus domestica TaxID=3750 RepID=A0A498HYJ8_MALDO|nr:hypothetical protein DVH24_029945 [Malus domestica]
MIARYSHVGIPLYLKGIFALFCPKIHVSPCDYFWLHNYYSHHHSRCVWYVGRDGTERDEAFRPAFGAPKMGGTGCSTGQILSVFAFHLPPWNGFVPRLWNAMFYHFKTNIPHVFFKNYTFVPSRLVPFRPVPFRPVPSHSVPFRLQMALMAVEGRQDRDS